MIQNLLVNLGFSTKEMKIYLAVLKRKRVTPSELARLTKINRATVYALVKSLVAKGFLAEDLGGKTLYIVPVASSELERIKEQDAKVLREKEKTLTSLMREVNLVMAEDSYPVPKIRFIQQEQIEDHLYKRSKDWNKSALTADSVWWGFQDHTFAEHYRAWINWLWSRTPARIELKLLTNHSDIEKRLDGKFKRRQMRFWKGEEQFSGTLWVAGDYLIMIVTGQNPRYLVEIHDAVLAGNLRQVFKALYNSVR